MLSFGATAFGAAPQIYTYTCTPVVVVSRSAFDRASFLFMYWICVHYDEGYLSSNSIMTLHLLRTQCDEYVAAFSLPKYLRHLREDAQKLVSCPRELDSILGGPSVDG